MEPLSLLTALYNIVKDPLMEAMWPTDRPVPEREVEDSFGDQFGAGMCAWISSVKTERLRQDGGYFFVIAQSDCARLFRLPNKSHNPNGREFLTWRSESVKRRERGD